MVERSQRLRSPGVRGGDARRGLPRHAGVVIVGGGAIGTSILFHLCEAGTHDAVLLERHELGSGSTSKAAGGVRAQFSDELNIRIAQRSVRAFEDFARRPGWEIELEQVGYLFLLTRPSEVEMFRDSVALQRRLGVPSELLSAARAADLCPLIDPAGVLAATFCPTDGHATPEGVVSGYATAARELGGHVATGCELAGIEIVGGRICGVSTTKSEISTDAVICAAGPWSGRVAALAGVDLPVTPVRRQVLFTGPLPGLPARLPMTVDFTSSFYFHREGPGLLMGMSYAGEKPGFSTARSDDWMPELAAAIARRAPRMLDAPIRGGWAGLYELSPDHNALIGEAAHVSRFLYATGFSGHGFLQAPGAGEIVRDLFLRRPPFVDVSELSAERFGRRPRPERAIV